MKLKVRILTIFFYIPNVLSNSLFDDDWQLVWEDEFDSLTVDTHLWIYDLGYGCGNWVGSCGWGNNEKQSYTNSTKNVYTSNGKLIIQADSLDKQYTSGSIRSKGKGDWIYGKIEVRAKFPKGEGLLPDIWLLPSYKNFGFWPAGGSIDIAIIQGYTSTRKAETIAHYDNSIYNKTHDEKILIEKLDVTEDFYKYTLLWEKDKLQWFIDDIFYQSVEKTNIFSYFDYPFNERFYLTLSLAVSGVDIADDLTKFPQRFEFDYVRVYQKL